MTDPFCEFLAQFVTPDRLETCEENLRNRTRHFTVVLEDLFHAHNASACMRSCDAFGIQNVHVIENENTYRINPDIELGSLKWMTLSRYAEGSDNSETCLQKLKADGYRIVATSPNASAITLEELDIQPRTAFFFGHEKKGLSDAVFQQADELLRIPMYGFAESFNISVAVAICLHHLTWKLRASEIDWRLTDEEANVIKFEWLKRIFVGRLPALEREFLRRENAENASS